MARPHVLALRPTGGQVGRVVRRADLPDLLRARHARPGSLPGLRRRPTTARPGRERRPDLSRVRGNQPRLLLRPLWLRGDAARWSDLRTVHSGRPARRPPRRRHRPGPPTPGTPDEPAPGARATQEQVDLAPNVVRLLRDLAAGRVPLTHAGLQPPRPAARLRIRRVRGGSSDPPRSPPTAGSQPAAAGRWPGLCTRTAGLRRG